MYFVEIAGKEYEIKRAADQSGEPTAADVTMHRYIARPAGILGIWPMVLGISDLRASNLWNATVFDERPTAGTPEHLASKSLAVLHNGAGRDVCHVASHKTLRQLLQIIDLDTGADGVERVELADVDANRWAVAANPVLTAGQLRDDQLDVWQHVVKRYTVRQATEITDRLNGDL